MLRWDTLKYVTGGHGDGFLFGVWFESRRVTRATRLVRFEPSRFEVCPT
jgi:hypothetical protein